MEEMKSDETRRGHSLIGILGIVVLALLMLVSIAGAETFAYIANSGSNTVSVIDTATNTVTATVPVGLQPYGVAVSLDGTKVYVTNTGSINDDGTISVIDTAKNKVTATVDLGTSPTYIAITPDGKKAYLTRAVYSGSVYVIDTIQNKFLTAVYAGNMPEGLAVNPEGTKVYLSDRAGNAISVVDTATNSVIKTVNVGNPSCGVAVSPDGKKVYVTEILNSTVAVIDTVTDTVESYVGVGYGPYGVAVSPDGTKVYVAHYLSDSVSVIDTATNAVATTVNVGDLPYVVSVTPDGNKVYVANKNSNSVSIIDPATNTVTDTINVGNYPLGIAIAKVPDRIVPIANFSSNVTKGYVPLDVQFTDISKNAATWKWDFGDGNTSTDQNPTHTYSAAGNYIVNLTVSDGNDTDSQVATITVSKKPVARAIYIYVANSGSNTVSVIDVATDTIIATIPVGIQPMGVAATLDGKKVYVTNLGNTVSVIDTATYNVIATVNASVPPKGLNVETLGVAVNPDGTKAYVACAYNIVGYNGMVSVIDVATDKVIATVPVGAWPNGVAVSPDGKKAYVTNQDSDTVSVIDTATNTVTATVNGLNYPGRVAVTPDGRKVYVLNNNNTISVIDTITNSVIDTFDIVNGLSGISFTPDGKKAYVTNDKNVSVIDTATNTVTANVIVGSSPAGVAVTSDGKKVYVTNYFSNTVSVIDTATNKVTSTVNVGRNPMAVGQFIFLPAQSLFPVANFSGNVTEGYVPLSVQFNDSSQYATGWNWDFGDGAFSTDQNTTHTYSAAGTYIVTLTASNENGTDSKTVTIDVLKATPTITWSNPADITYGAALNETQLNAVSSVPGTFVYTPSSGILSVGTHTLRADFTPTDTANYTPASKDITIKVLEKPAIPVADFSASPTIGEAPLKVTFTDSSTGSPTAWKWSFGDGSALVTDQNPEYTYSKAGVYTVKHTAINAYGRSTEIKTNYITVGSVSPNADFSASTTSGNAPLTVKFTDKSTGSPTEWKWSFGDGSALVTQYNPTYTYTKPGTYTVKETVSNAAGKDTEIKTNYITVTAPLKAPVAAMSASPTSGNAPLKVQFTDKSTNYPTSWKWSFGDGTYSTDQNPAHTYTKAGKYTIVLTAKNAKGSNTVTKSSYINVAAPLKAPVTAFSATPVSGNTPLKVQFTDSSTGFPTSWKWDFGDKSSSTEKNPAHTYSAAGTYTVKLTATNAAGSNTVTKTSYITVKVASTSSNVYISGLRLGASGETPNQEYVQITNKGTTDAKMNGWKITDSGSIHTYNFLSSYTLKAKTTVTLYTGKGTNTATKLFWGKGVYVWNNEGDTAYLYNAQGTLVSKLTK